MIPRTYFCDLIPALTYVDSTVCWKHDAQSAFDVVRWRNPGRNSLDLAANCGANPRIDVQ